MPTVVVLGAHGVVARHVSRQLHAAGLTVVGVVRQSAQLVSSPNVDDDEAGAYTHIRRADLSDPSQRATVLGDADLVINALGPMRRCAFDLARAACEVGVPLVDVGSDQTVMAQIDEQLSSYAVDRGVRLVVGAGLQHLAGETLAVLAARTTTEVAEVHIAYLLPGQTGGRRAATTGRRRSLAAELGAPALALVGGRRVREPVAEQRRLAWFPRPVGPSHAASFAGGEAITLPRSLPEARVVRTYLALAAWRAELLQAQATAARNPVIARWLRRRLVHAGPDLEAARRKVLRWACVAEVGSGAGRVARAWAYGHDPYTTTASGAAHVARRVLQGAGPPGVIGPAQVDDPAELLHTVAATSDLRWAVAATRTPDRGGRETSRIEERPTRRRVDPSSGGNLR